MTFLNPLGLIGLLSLPVILLLHLLRERQRRYVVSSLELWSFLDLQVRGPRTRRIPLTRLLLLDLLIAMLISLAWAQPSLAIDLPGKRARHLVVVLDVSASMLAGDGALTRFAQAQTQAAQLVNDARPGDRVTLVTFGRQARIAGDSRITGDAGELAAGLLALQAGESGASGAALRDALALGQAALDPDLPPEFHVFSDGAFESGGLGAALGDAGAATFPYPIEWRWQGSAVDNQAVVAINAAEVGEGRVEVFARIANFGDRAVSRRAVLSIGGRAIDQAALDLPANSSVARVWQAALQPGEETAAVMVILDGRDALRDDDYAAAGLQAGGVARVALVGDDPARLLQAVEAVPGAEARVFTPQEYQAAAQAGGVTEYDLAIFHGVLPVEWPAGAMLVVEPPTGEGSGVLQVEGTRGIAAGAPLQTPNPGLATAGIDFSGVRWGRALRLAETPPGFAVLLQAGDAPLLLGGNIPLDGGGSSRVLLLLADLGQGNFTKHPAFPILIANIVDQARRSPLPASFKTGEALALPASGSYTALRIVNPDNQSRDYQGRWPETWNDTLRPGIYRLELAGAGGEARVFSAAANAGDEGESDLRRRAWTQAVDRGPQAAALLPEREDPALDLWPWLLAAAILAMCAEAMLAWRN